MAKAIKYILFSVVGLILLFVAGAVVLVATIDPNEYKSEIATSVKDATGRDLRFQGDIEFNFFPWLGLKVGPVALGNRAGFAPDDMVRINKAEASLEIMPLLSGNISVGELMLDGFTLNLTVNPQGMNNWADLAKGKQEPPTQKEKKDEQGASDSKGSPLESITIGGVSVTNANVVFDDQQAGKRTSVSNLNLLIGEVGDMITTPIELRFDLNLDDPAIETAPTLKAMLTMDKEAGTARLTDFVLTFLNMTMTGDFFAKYLDGNLNYSGELNIAELSLRELMQQLKMEVPTTTDPNVLTRFSSALKIDGSDTQVAMQSLTVKLDDTTISGNGSVTNFQKPAIKVAVNVDDIDADRYMPPSSDKKEQPEAKPEPKSDTPAEEPDLSGLRELDLQAKLTVGKAKAVNLRVSDILCELVAKNGIVTVKPFSAQLYEGKLNASSVLNVNSKLATWKESATLSGVQAGPLLKDMVGKDHILGGTSAKYNLTGSGLTPDNIKKSISGTTSFAFADGAINGINIAKMLRDAQNALTGKRTSGETPVRTDFAELSGSTVIKKGHITNNDMIMKSPLLRVTGKGWANLPKNNVDYLTTVTIVGTLKGQEGEELKDLAGIPIPVYAKGSLDAPKIGLDTKALAEALFKGKVKEGILGGDVGKILGGQKSGKSSGKGTSTDKNKEPLNILKKLF